LGVPRGADGTWTADLSKLIKGGENVTNVQTTTQEATASGTTVSWSDEAVEKVEVTYDYTTGSGTMSVTLTLIPGDAVLYTITFDANGGEVTPLTATTDASGKLASLPTPTRGGYRFAGWYTSADGGARVTENTVFTQNMTIYAHWSADVLPVGGSGEDGVVLPADDLPHITAPSVAQEIAAEAGERAKMAITAENVGTYQWYVDRGDGKGYVALSGATSAMYETSPVNTANDGYKYICVVTNEHGSATSPVFTLRVLGATALPSTGDGAPLAAWAALLALSGCGAALLKKRKTGEAR
ncbi:MAG TPA: InlB B-repeat-containing protein, partial [Candidatus Aphodomonas merdavium]|nr:InlB B-repeat-containing protein [Candidatus Aphodomonas merdavium]